MVMGPTAPTGVYQINATSYTEPASFKLISEQILTSTATDIDFTGLDLEDAGIYYLEIISKKTATGVDGIYLYMNDDTTDSNYKTQQFWADNTTVNAENTTNTPFIGLGADTTGQIYIKVSISKMSGGKPMFHCNWIDAGYPRGGLYLGSKNSTDNVTEIKLRNGTSNGWVSGTFVRLYQMRGG